MHKKLETDLMSLAHSILQMKNKENVFLLKQKAQEIYEKIAVLAFVEEYVNTTPNSLETKEVLTAKVEKAFEEKAKKLIEEEVVEGILISSTAMSLEVESKKLEAVIVDDFVEEEVEEEDEKEEAMEQSLDVLTSLAPEDTKDAEQPKVLTLEEELEDTISVDVIASLFEPVKPNSLNEKLHIHIQIDLNDRIVFVKNLFDSSQEDFNRVISQLNTFKTEKEAKKFISKMVKPNYNWSEHEELEQRLNTIIERKFN